MVPYRREQQRRVEGTYWRDSIAYLDRYGSHSMFMESISSYSVFTNECINRLAQHLSIVSIIPYLSVCCFPAFYVSSTSTSVQHRLSVSHPQFPLSSHILAIFFLPRRHWIRKRSDVGLSEIFRSPKRRGETHCIRRICMTRPRTTGSHRGSDYAPQRNLCGLSLPNSSPTTETRKPAQLCFDLATRSIHTHTKELLGRRLFYTRP